VPDPSSEKFSEAVGPLLPLAQDFLEVKKKEMNLLQKRHDSQMKFAEVALAFDKERDRRGF
jgi:hypothetical protein